MTLTVTGKGDDFSYSEISYNHTVQIINVNDKLFEKGFCSNCCHSLGQRTSVPIEVDHKPNKTVMGASGIYPSMKIYSQNFIDLILAPNDQRFELRPVLFKGKDSGYLEVISKKWINCVGFKGGEYPTRFQECWKCNECKQEQLAVYSTAHNFGTVFVSANNFTKDRPKLISISNGVKCSLAIRNDYWSDIIKSKYSQGIYSDSVVILDEDSIEIPSIKFTEQFDWI